MDFLKFEKHISKLKLDFSFRKKKKRYTLFLTPNNLFFLPFNLNNLFFFSFRQIYLKQNFQDGLALHTLYVNDLMISKVNMMIEEGLLQSQWINSMEFIPSPLEEEDAYILLEKCECISNTNAKIVNGKYIVTNAAVESFQQLAENYAKKKAKEDPIIEKRQQIEEEEEDTKTSRGSKKKTTKKSAPSKRKSSSVTTKATKKIEIEEIVQLIKSNISPKTGDDENEMIEELSQQFLDSSNQIYLRESKSVLLSSNTIEQQKLGDFHQKLTANYHNLLLFSESVSSFKDRKKKFFYFRFFFVPKKKQIKRLIKKIKIKTKIKIKKIKTKKKN